MILFESHITLSKLERNELDNFITFCKNIHGKPLWIELSRGDFIQQPMLNLLSKQSQISGALNESRRHSNSLIERGWEVERIKIEIPFSDLNRYLTSHAQHNVIYHEWHGKIQLHSRIELEKVCERNGVHLARNALKLNEQIHFITLREFASPELFQLRLKQLKLDLESGPWPLLKEQAESCVFDSNLYLDHGWLEPAQ
ncbi:MAG: hypothetical protein EP332_09005 [Bacteroidetes bacterium]|nr:MAG: hypothetical protein EP332_09005 [Bacteroidota bacterium]